MTNEEKNWVNDELGKVEDIPEEQVEQMVDEIPQESEGEDISKEQFDELVHEVTAYVDGLNAKLSKYGHSIYVSVSSKDRRASIMAGSRICCKAHLAYISKDLINVFNQMESESGEHED